MRRQIVVSVCVTACLPVKHDVEAVELVTVLVRDHDGLHALDRPAYAYTTNVNLCNLLMIGVPKRSQISLLTKRYRMMSLLTSAHARLLA